MNPKDEFSDPMSDSSAETALQKKHTVPNGPIVVVLVAIVCLAIVFWFIYTIWTAPEQTIVTIPTPVPETVEEFVDPTTIYGRDPNILGLRIDPTIGRFFTLPDTGQTLYVATEECVDTCLESWTPYTTETAITDAANLGTTERPDSGSLQYTWQGEALYTYTLDTERSVLGDGYEGKWKIARP